MILNKKILVTCALPYANGPIHLGHLVEHIQADIWVRYKRMNGIKTYFICADDAHGTPIMLKANQLGISPEQMIKNINLEHQNDLSKFNISYDNYYSTHSSENYKLSILIYNKLKKKGLIKSNSIHQLFDFKENIFLSDRFVRGKCPKCLAPEQYGDNCEICGAYYNSVELINPISIISNTIPIIKKTTHFFFNLPFFNDMLKNWIKSSISQKPITNKINEWLKYGLKKWDISRDALYFGFEIPRCSGKYFYVWFDAPIGYMGTFKNLCSKIKNISFKEFWDVNSNAELYHFIGKDVIYFHSLFWPAILEGSNFRKPTNIFVHGYVTVNGLKMSKSKNTFIKASTYLSYFDAECLRYYYASKLSSHINDIDFNTKDFINKINTDIVNKIVNLASRNAYFINKYFSNKLYHKIYDIELYNIFKKEIFIIDKYYNNRETNNVIKKVIILANLANKYTNQQAPWNFSNKNKNNYKLHSICSLGIEFFRIIMIYLKPILPSLAKKTEEFLNTKLTWKFNIEPLGNHRINQFKKLFNRIKLSTAEDMLKNKL